MKIIILSTLLSLTLMFTSQVCQAQTAVMDEISVQETQQTEQPTIEKKGFFSRILGSAKDNLLELVISFIVGIFAKHGWTKTIKKVSSRGAVITKELSELLAVTSDGLNTLNKSIQENGKYKENSLDEILASKKRFVAELNDVIVSIKPK